MSRETKVGEAKITWLGHASFLVEGMGRAVYVDPYKVNHGPKADLILITHDHYDHCDPGSVANLKKEGTVIVGPRGVRAKLPEALEIKVGNLIEKKDVQVMAVPAYNMNKSFHPQGHGVGYVFKLADKRIYHAGDTDRIPEMDDLGEIDVALLPIGGTYTMDPAEASDAANKIRAGLTIPMHWGGIVGNRSDAERFRKLCHVEVRILG